MSVFPTGPLAAVSTAPTGARVPKIHAAAEVVRVMRELDAALAPVIGTRGVAALCRRSLHMAAERHPCIADACGDGRDTALNFDGLARALGRQRSEDAAAAGAALVLGFHDLLASLVGVPLTAQLLAGVPLDLPGNAASRGPNR